MTKAEFIEFSAVLAGIKEIKQVMADAERARQYGTRTIVFIDEIHRFNKAQQDAFLPHVERGNIRLIGATTENPSFEVNSALLSRSRVYTLNPLTEEQIVRLLRRALADEERGLGEMKLRRTDEVLTKIASLFQRRCAQAYNVLEVAAGVGNRHAPATEKGRSASRTITDDIVQDALQKRVLLYDKAGEEHYNLISALHKSVRNSDPDAALYWLVRMLEAAKIRCIWRGGSCAWRWKILGWPIPHALELCMAARDAVDFMGLPEGDLALAQAAVYLAVAPKSNALYTAYGAVKRDVEETAADPVPLHLRNAPTRLMKGLGYGKGYNTRTTSKGKSRTWSACRKICAAASITSRPTRGLRNASANGWSRSRPRVQKNRARGLSCADVMFLEDATVHHHENLCPARFFGCLLVDHIFLHPDRRDFELNRLIDNLLHKFGAPKNIHDINLPGNVEQRRVGGLTEAFVDIRVDRNNTVSVLLHIGGNAVTGTQRIARQSDHRNGFRFFQQIGNRIVLD